MSIDLQTKKFGVVGCGETGLSVIKYLIRKNLYLKKIFDTRDSPPNIEVINDLIKDKSVSSHFGTLDFNLIKDLDILVLSPGVSIYEKSLQMAIQNNIQIIGDIELFGIIVKEHANTKVIAITGTNGKTTVTELTGYLLKSIGKSTLIAGNIGLPVLDILADIDDKMPEFIVLEISSFQLETIRHLQLDVATVLNITEDHLDRYNCLLEYAYVKSQIFNNCKKMLLNLDDNFVMAMKRPQREIYYFSINNFSCDFSINNNYLCVLEKEYLKISDLKLIGLHNYANCLASLGLLYAVGIDIDNNELKNALVNFNGMPHRMQVIGKYNEVYYIEDSKGTNVGATIAGVRGLSMNVHLILGGDGKGQDFTPLYELVKNKCKSVAIIGKDKNKIYDVLKKLTIPIKCFDTLEDSIDFLSKMAQKDEAIVLSPACASWDMFNNYKHRAEVFIDYVRKNQKNI